MRAVKLGEVCTARSSLVNPRHPENEDLPHIAPDSIERDTGRLREFQSVREDGVTSGKYRFERGDVLYSKIRPNLNKVTLVNFAGLCSADMYALNVDGRLATPEFIAHLLRGRDFLDYATSLSNRANIPKLNRVQLMRFQFSLPTVDEQRRIAAILDQAGTLRAKRRQVLTHVQSLPQSIFREMFERSGGVAVALDDISSVTSGITKGRRTSEPTVPTPFLAVSNVQAGRLDLSSVKTIDATPTEVLRYALQVGDLVLTEGGDPDKLGRGTLWGGELPLCLHQNHIFRVRIRNDADVRPEYLAAFMSSWVARSYFLRAAKQTTGIASINMTQLKALSVRVPDLLLQDRFVDRVRSVAVQISCATAALAAADELFASLQARAFRGEL